MVKKKLGLGSIIVSALILVVFLVLAIIVIASCGLPSNSSTPTQSASSSSPTPYPPTAQEAIAMVKSSPDMSEYVAPFKQELDWKAEWVDDRWYVVGLFESPWGVRFVRDAIILDGRVYAYAPGFYEMRPPYEWVVSKAHEWGLTTLYTRLTPEIAIEQVKKSEDVRYALQDVEVLDAVAKLVEDNAEAQQWCFAFYVQRKDGSRAVLVVGGGLGTIGAKEGNYINEYGFGDATKAYWEIPLNLTDWVRSVVKDRYWKNVANLP